MTPPTNHSDPENLPSLPSSLRPLKIALVHYWFVNGLGGERVSRILARMFPQADIFSMFVNADCLPEDLKQRHINTSFLQRIPRIHKNYRFLMPLFPLALEQFDFSEYDLVISAEAGPAKGIITSPNTCHICFCHSPMRYIWDMYPLYRKEPGLGRLSRLIFSLSAHYMRLWDYSAAQRVDHYVAISNYVASRIKKFYQREATVIHPPLNVGGYISDRIDDYYLVVSRLVDYKRIDLAIEACNRLGRKLRIVGDGEQYKNLKKIAGPTIEFLGFISNEEVREQFAHCRAFLFPGEEDLGATPVEAMSFGRPVIALGKGGVLDTVNGMRPGEPFQPDHTGVFFEKQNVESLMEAMLAFEAIESQFSSESLRESALYFDEPRFRKQLYEYVEQKYEEFASNKHANAGIKQESAYAHD